MKKATKSTILLLLICALIFICRSLNQPKQVETIKEPEKAVPAYVSAVDIFNDMAKPTPWIYGFIDRNQHKFAPEKEQSFMITDRLKKPSNLTKLDDKLRKIMASAADDTDDLIKDYASRTSDV